MLWERLQMAWTIFVTWLETRVGFTEDEALHCLGGFLVALSVWLSPWWVQGPLAGCWVGYLREVCQAQAAGKPNPWNPTYWSDHRLREWAAWPVGGTVVSIARALYGDV